MTDAPALDDPSAPIHEDRLWRDNGWTARVVKNEDDDGWAVEMVKDGEPEPALVGPWTMGRDKRNPKPLDTSAFLTLVKTAAEVIRRHEQQSAADRHKSVVVSSGAARVTVKLDIESGDDDPQAELSAFDDEDRELARVRVSAGFRLNLRSALEWVESGYRRPR